MARKTDINDNWGFHPLPFEPKKRAKEAESKLKEVLDILNEIDPVDLTKLNQEDQIEARKLLDTMMETLKDWDHQIVSKVFSEAIDTFMDEQGKNLAEAIEEVTDKGTLNPSQVFEKVTKDK